MNRRTDSNRSPRWTELWGGRCGRGLIDLFSVWGGAIDCIGDFVLSHPKFSLDIAQ